MDLAAFRIRFPQFAAVPDATVELYATDAACFLATAGCQCEELQEQLLTAHLLALNLPAQSGGDSPAAGAVTSATVGKVSVTVAAPPSRGAWGHWMAQTPYGQQLWALLSRCAVGGVYVGGSPVRGSFRGYR